MIEARLRTFEPHGLQHIHTAKARDRACEQRLMPGGFDEGLGRQIINLIRFDLTQNTNETGEIGQIAINELDVARNIEPAQTRIIHIRCAGAPHQSIDLVILFKQEL